MWGCGCLFFTDNIISISFLKKTFKQKSHSGMVMSFPHLKKRFPAWREMTSMWSSEARFSHVRFGSNVGQIGHKSPAQKSNEILSEKSGRLFLPFGDNLWTRKVKIGPKRFGLAPNGTNSGLFQNIFQLNCTEIWSEKKTGFVPLGVQSDPLWSQTYHPCAWWQSNL